MFRIISSAQTEPMFPIWKLSIINFLCISSTRLTSIFDIGLLFDTYTILISSPVHLAKHWSILILTVSCYVVVVYPLPWPLLVGGVRCSRLWSTSQLLRPSGQQCSHSGGVCAQIQGRQCGAYVGAVEEMMCVVCVDVTEGA